MAGPCMLNMPSCGQIVKEIVSGGVYYVKIAFKCSSVVVLTTYSTQM